MLEQTKCSAYPKVYFFQLLDCPKKKAADLNFKLTQSNFLLVYLFVCNCQQRKKSILYTLLPRMCLPQVCNKRFACQTPLQRVHDVNLTGEAEEARSCSWSGWDLIWKSPSPTCSPETALSFPFKYKYFHSNNTSHSARTTIIFMYQNPHSHRW